MKRKNWLLREQLRGCEPTLAALSFTSTMLILLTLYHGLLVMITKLPIRYLHMEVYSLSEEFTMGVPMWTLVM